MSKQTIIVIVGAFVLFGIGIVGAMAFTGGGSDSPVMTMQGGSTMPSDQMSLNRGTQTTKNGGTMTGMDGTP